MKVTLSEASRSQVAAFSCPSLQHRDEVIFEVRKKAGSMRSVQAKIQAVPMGIPDIKARYFSSLVLITASWSHQLRMYRYTTSRCGALPR
eukprot:767175-Hanusia_phi.AAC.5